MQDDPLFRRIRQHAENRLAFSESQPDKERLALLKEFMRLEDEMLRRYHAKGDSGLRVARARAVLIDVLVQTLHAYALRLARDNLGKLKPMALLATGGYGRGELSPHSDVDLTFLYPKAAAGKALELLKETMTREILYPLWDLGLKVGHSSRTVSEAIEESRKDIRTKNAQLDSRHLCGDSNVTKRYLHKFARFLRKDDPSGYIRQIMEDRSGQRREKGNTVFLQAPDLKNGVGGLRDYQNILWMARVKFDEPDAPLDALVQRDHLTLSEAKTFRESYSFLLRVRNELHFRSKRPSDVLHLEKQPEVALGLGYEQEDLLERVEAFMGDYYTQARSILQTAEALEGRLAAGIASRTARITLSSVLQAYRSPPPEIIDEFELSHNQLHTSDPKIFDRDPERLLRLFRHAQHRGATLSPELRSLIRNKLSLINSDLIHSPSANVSFRSILQQVGAVHPTLADMHDLGVLGRFVPEFDRLTCKVQLELYHRYTADVHVLRCIAELDKVFQAPDERSRHYRDILRKTETPALLYLILFLHDLGKDQGPKGHCERGVDIAHSLMQRLAVPDEMRERVTFVVRHHLEMVRYFNKFDLGDPEVIEAFAAFTQGHQRLRYLCVHTYCDANGTSPDLWNNHKDDLHRQLFDSTLRVLGGRPARRDPADLRAAHIRLQVPGLSRERIAAHLQALPDRYFSHAGEEEIALHLSMTARYLGRASPETISLRHPPAIEWRDDLRRSLTIVHLVIKDRPALFARFAGSFAVAGMNILGSRAFTRSDGITIDVFFVESEKGGPADDPRTREAFHQIVNEILTQNADPLPLIRERARKLETKTPFSLKDRIGATIAPDVNVYRDVAVGRTIVEVRAADRLGLLHLIAQNIADCGLDIAFARIATEQNIATDVFHVRPNIPEETYSPTRYLDLRERLSQALAEGRYQMEV